MEDIVACCGCICDECPYYQKECEGYPKTQGKPFWPEHIGEERCGIYRCCVEEEKLSHCGRCSELPCSRCDQQGPARTPEENAVSLKRMLEVLRSLD